MIHIFQESVSLCWAGKRKKDRVFLFNFFYQENDGRYRESYYKNGDGVLVCFL